MKSFLVVTGILAYALIAGMTVVSCIDYTSLAKPIVCNASDPKHVECHEVQP